MADWGPVVIAVVLFVLLSPGLLFQVPGRNRVVEFGCILVVYLFWFIQSSFLDSLQSFLLPLVFILTLVNSFSSNYYSLPLILVLVWFEVMLVFIFWNI